MMVSSGEGSRRRRNTTSEVPGGAVLCCAPAGDELRIDLRLDIHALRSKKNDQPADGQSGHEVIATRNAFSEAENGIALEGAGITQYVILGDILLDFALHQFAKRDIGRFGSGKHSPCLRVNDGKRGYKLEFAPGKFSQKLSSFHLVAGLLVNPAVLRHDCIPGDDHRV